MVGEGQAGVVAPGRVGARPVVMLDNFLEMERAWRDVSWSLLDCLVQW
jgi:hypothetical protein